MASTAHPDLPARSNRGLFVVIILAVIFFALMGALLLLPSKHREPAVEALDLFVVPPQLRLRTEPTGKAPVLATLSHDDKVKQLQDEGAWVRVESAEGVSGWAERNLLEASAEHERRTTRVAAILKLPPLQGVADQETPLYSGPGIFYPVSGELKRGTSVRVYTRDHDFYAIDSKGGIAYADVDAINVTASAGTPLLEVAVAKTDTDTIPGRHESPSETHRSEPPPMLEPPDEPEPVEPPEVEPRPAAASSFGVYAAVPAGGRDPQVLNRSLPEYPRLARSSNVEGTVVIRGIVRRNGTIDSVEIVKDLPYGLGEAARRAVRRWEFKPATYQGESIDVYYTVTVNFRLAS